MEKAPTNRDGLNAAFTAAGSGAALARELGLSRNAVHQWKKNGEIPLDWIRKVEEITGIDWRVLRPDFAVEWRLIETVPKDGNDVLAWYPNLSRMVVNSDLLACAQGATHWQPLPAPPQDQS